jgi:hypothetical protein
MRASLVGAVKENVTALYQLALPASGKIRQVFYPPTGPEINSINSMSRLCVYDESSEQGSVHSNITEAHGPSSFETSVCATPSGVFRLKVSLTTSRCSVLHLKQRCREKFAVL